jgi:hypothetical protein
MKPNKFTSALVALGIISMVGAAQANTVIYLTGSTAARAVIFAAAQAAGGIFTNATGGQVVSPSPNNTSSANTIVYEGGVAGVGTVDLDCSFTGSEVGIQAVAQVAALTQTLANSSVGSGGVGTYPLPGATPAFLTASSGWTTTQTLPIAGGVSYPDLAMADTSQSVSQTSKSLHPLNDYGIVGIVPFTWMKGYEATKDSSWTNLVNVTTAQINQNLAGLISANFYTGNTNDTDFCYIIGRNFGSGTHVNTLLNAQYGINTPVDQWAWDANYSTPGVLAFGGLYGSGQTLYEVVNDGFDSGGNVAKELEVDGSGSGKIILGYLGIPDSQTAVAGTSGTGSGPAVYLPYNGVYESDSAVENGSYSYWGQEHLFGTHGQSGAALTVGTATKNGIVNYSIAHLGAATGSVLTNPNAQSVLIPESFMQASRGSDGGFPAQGGF